MSLPKKCLSAWTAEEEGVALFKPPTAKRLPLRLAAAESVSGVSGRVFHTDMGLADWQGGEMAL